MYKVTIKNKDGSTRVEQKAMLPAVANGLVKAHPNNVASVEEM
jgi:hypothetical protein